MQQTAFLLSPNLSPPEKVYHLKQPAFPQFRFEWHPGKKKVYLIRLGVEPLMGTAFAHDIENHGAAYNAVLIWLRGYREAKMELSNAV